MIVLGLTWGSFLNVCIYRIPLKKNLILSRSVCPHCQNKISWYDNIPILSYLVLGGKCRFCKKKISIQYPVVELSSSLLLLLSYLKFDLTWQFFSSAVLISILILVFFIDFYHKIIPDVISLPGIVLGLVFSCFNPQFSFSSSVIGFLSGGLSFYLLAFVGEAVFKKESMGGGDIKLAALLGAFLGWKNLILVILLASFLGALMGVLKLSLSKSKKDKTIPFGPFLAIASIVALFWGDKLIGLYLSYFFPR
ncbi:MAG: hypothetical protein A2145_04140 [candidate division Zixibacteria bacterium RBG_16_40_9]|nr:MAG: hypothetical protein A2145_04140 [candidate division Zixibacteria bacterium RBG_16_40_9]